MTCHCVEILSCVVLSIVFYGLFSYSPLLLVFCSWWWRRHKFGGNACFKLSESQLQSAVFPNIIHKARAYQRVKGIYMPSLTTAFREQRWFRRWVLTPTYEAVNTRTKEITIIWHWQLLLWWESPFKWVHFLSLYWVTSFGIRNLLYNTWTD